MVLMQFSFKIGPFANLCETPQFAINFRSQIEKQFAITGSWEPLVLDMFLSNFYSFAKQINGNNRKMPNSRQANSLSILNAF